jgi:hypothetical protein
MYDGSTKCCGAPGTPPEADPCSYINSPQYVATQQAAAAAALLPGGAGPIGAALLASISQYPQNVQSDALNCVSNPGLTFTDPQGFQITCPAAFTNDNGIKVSIYTPAQIAAMIAGAATPSNETAINVAGTGLPQTFANSAPFNTRGAAGNTQSISPTVRLVNTSGGSNSSFNAGDSWQIVVTGTPNAQVSASASQNGTSLGTTSMGTIGSNGQLVLTGTFAAGQAGSWIENWTVGGKAAGSISFSVAAPSGGNGGNAGAGGNAGGSGGSGGSGSTAANPFGFLTGTFNIGSVAIPIWAAGGAAILAAFMFSGKR